MRHGRYIYVIGDVHAEWGRLNDFINYKIRMNKTLRSITPYWKADGDDLQAMILQCGDFAYFWPGSDNSGKIRNQVDWLPGGRVPIYWIGGNHENWDRLDCLGPCITEIDRGIFFCPFGSTLEISPDVTVLFAGGAESVDKAQRLRYMAQGALPCWWPQEGVSEADLATLVNVPKADWVISHTAPAAFDVGSKLRNVWGDPSHLDEPSRQMLNQVLYKYNPQKWFFGHFHQPMQGKDAGCEWMCLNELGGSGKFCEKIYLEWRD